MSWSVQAIGRVGAVKREIDAQFERGGKCSEPEETIRGAARQLIASSLASYGEDSLAVVSVSANGLQSSSYNDGK